MFFALSQTNFAILATFELSSASVLNLNRSNIFLLGKDLSRICFNSDQSKILLSRNGLTHSHTMAPFDAPGKQAF